LPNLHFSLTLYQGLGTYSDVVLMERRMSKDRTANLAFQRFGLGAKSGGLSAIVGDPRGALLSEIAPALALISDTSLPKTARAIQIVAEIEEKRRLARAQQRQIAQANAAPASAGTPTPATPPQVANATAMPGQPPQMMRDPDEVRLNDHFLAELRARAEHAMAQPVGFAERWVMFWSNHFAVATRRGTIMRGAVGAYEREAIRPHVFGRFTDLLVAVETHPAMLHYLDQRQSIGPNSPAGQRQKRGLNENLAREILELHTLGVGGGYAQADVTNFAKILTGWSVTGFEENIDGYGGFHFAANRHEPGAHEVLGKRYGQEGKEQGLAVLRDLAVHPSTATFLATKLAKHFVADQPPATLVARLREAFRTSGGDLGAVARTLIEAKEAWEAPPSKLRTPNEFLIALYRALGEKVDRPQRLNGELNLMGQPLWNPSGPNGHADDVASIAAPKAIKTRLDLSLAYARAAAARHDPRGLAAALYGDAISPETRQAIARAETRPQGLAILFMSPEFQRR
jgi:uncharacterized protein (DUF1800 family)